MKNQSLKVAIVVRICFALAVGIAVINVLIGVQSAKMAQNLTNQLVGEMLERYAFQLEDMGQEALSVAATTMELVENMRMMENGREKLIESFQVIISESNSIMGVWMVWEPDQFDGRDAQYRNAPYHDESGRFIPFVYELDGEIQIRRLYNYEDPELADYYYGAVNKGGIYVGVPTEYPSNTEEPLITFSVTIPYYDGDQIVGAIGVAVDLKSLSSKMSQATILRDGYLLVVAHNGVIATSPHTPYIMQHYASRWLKGHEEEMEALFTGGDEIQFHAYNEFLEKNVLVVPQAVPMPGNDRHWAVLAIVPKSTVRESARNMNILIGFCSLILIVGIGSSLYIIVGKSLKDLPELTHAAQAYADGNIDDVEMPLDAGEPTKNEVILLKRSFSRMVAMTKVLAYGMHKIAAGDFSADVEPRTDKDILAISLKEILSSNNRVFRTIRETTAVVNSSAVQISTTAQVVAQAAEEQAASMEQLSEAIQEVTDKSTENEVLAKQAADFSNEVRGIADLGAQKLEQMIQAVNGINESSQNIDNVIRMIEDIAFQTNILALNAAVEAARAGQHGKGFAVVAEEVRNLAGKSAAAAKNTSAMISDTHSKAELGAKIAEETAEILNRIITQVSRSSEIVNEIPRYSKRQAETIHRIRDGIQQMAGSTQQNSSMAQESAATSEELSNQAQLLQQMVSEFQLHESVANYSPMMERHVTHGFASSPEPVYDDALLQEWEPNESKY